MLLELTGSWELKEATVPDAVAAAQAEGEWQPATVPGCVHTDLMAAGRIPDPFYGFNDLEVQWVADRDWLYRHTFDCPAEVLQKRRVELACDGLDTYADVCLNGQRLARTDNMFRRWRWDVTGLLKESGNELLVLFESPVRKSAEVCEANPGLGEKRRDPSRSYVRKAQYAFGWDWGPVLNTSGVWRPIYLEAYDEGRLADVCARISWDDPARPVVHAIIEIEAVAEARATVHAALSEHGCKAEASADVEMKAGPKTVELELPVDDPQLWWPASAGPQNLYALSVDVTTPAGQLGAKEISVGLRRVELVREKDDEGESFVLHVNGEPIFCRGANWIPADSFLPRVTARDYEEWVKAARDANMNMLRAWGGGIYEDDAFFDACDRMGVMVWIDFGFACATYPDFLDWFCDSVRAEAEDNVRRLRNHPSLVAWCGNNECQWLRPGYPGDKLYDEVLPEVCARLDPTRPYWPGSPYGGEDANDPSQGDQHCWRPWSMWGAPEEYRNYNGRFVSEFGMQALPPMETIRESIPSSGHHVQSRAMEHHNRMGRGTERLFCYLSAIFHVPTDLEDMVYLTQLMQGEYIKMGVEHWRSRKFRTAGALFWQHNDCWPVTSWSCMDYKRRPKALWYYARRFFAPVLPVIDRRNGQYSVAVVNDLLQPFEGELVCGYGRLSGDQQWVHKEQVVVPANSVASTVVKPESELTDAGSPEHYFWCRLLRDHEEVGRNTWLPLPCKHMRLSRPEWQAEVSRLTPRRFDVRLSADTFAKGVWLSLEGVEAEFSDNFFDVMAEVPVTLELTTTDDFEAAEVHRRLSVRSVAETRRGDMA